jgi:23S rRNA (uracil1939-C5)-methyltransferase
MPALPAAQGVQITRLGAEGDGVGLLADDAPAYVAGSLPGERVLVVPRIKRGDGWSAERSEIVEPSSERVVAPCPHFGVCGGCVLQHASAALYADFKRNLLAAALRRAGVDVAVGALIRTPPASRRRLDLAAARAGKHILLGLHKRFGSDVVDLASCPVTEPALVGLLQDLRRLLGGLTGLRRSGAVVLNLLETGPDLLLRTDAALSTADRAACAGFAAAHRIPRISWAGREGPETVAQLGPAAVRFDGVVVQPPPGAFLQASAAGEAAIRDAVVAGLPSFTAKGRIVELYAGVGTLTFGLAQRARVLAYEGAADAAAALRRAAGGQRIEVFTRDLARQPVAAAELKGAACVVLDPPFAGAGPQLAAIAASNVARVIYVSCNPAVLGREVGVLRAAGYRAVAATPIDQFLWSARLEAVVVMERG